MARAGNHLAVQLPLSTNSTALIAPWAKEHRHQLISAPNHLSQASNVTSGDQLEKLRGGNAYFLTIVDDLL
jgi:hypothetical protein